MFSIRAYCSTCNKLLMESNYFYRHDLDKKWDMAVLGATAIPCKDCDHKVPNFNINLKVYDKTLDVEVDPKVFFPKGNFFKDEETK